MAKDIALTFRIYDLESFSYVELKSLRALDLNYRVPSKDHTQFWLDVRDDLLILDALHIDCNTSSNMIREMEKELCFELTSPDDEDWIFKFRDPCTVNVSISIEYFMDKILNRIHKSPSVSRTILRYLKPLKLLSVFMKDSGRMSSYFNEFLEILYDSRIVPQTYLEVVKFFHSSPCSLSFTSIEPSQLYYTIHCSKTVKYDFFNLWHDVNHDKCKNFKNELMCAPALAQLLMHSRMMCCEYLISNGVKNHTFLDRNGAFRTTIADFIRTYKQRGNFCNGQMYLPVRNRRNYLICQIVLLYLQSKTRAPESALLILNRLWLGMPDLLITREEFFTSFHDPPNHFKNFLRLIWEWYEDVVWQRQNSPRGIRLLRHLACIAIRYRMAECFNIPGGVEALPVPKFLKQQILLMT